VTELINSLAVLVGSGIGSLVLAFFLRRYFQMIPAFNSLVLTPPEPEMRPPASATEPRSKQWYLGREGQTTTPLRPAGKARFEGEQVDVHAEGSYVPTGRMVRVVEIRGNRIIVVEV
jgi:membrane-bound serine protease (ClpP class)